MLGEGEEAVERRNGVSSLGVTAAANNGSGGRGRGRSGDGRYGLIEQTGQRPPFAWSTTPPHPTSLEHERCGCLELLQHLQLD